MIYQELLETKVLYAIPYLDNPIIYALPVNKTNKMRHIGGANKYLIEVVFPNGDIKYLRLYDRYVNNPKGDDISNPFINEFSKYLDWNLDSINDDHTKYLIFNDRERLIEEYIKQLKEKIDYDKETIHNLSNEIIRNQQTIDYIKQQNYGK